MYSFPEIKFTETNSATEQLNHVKEEYIEVKQAQMEGKWGDVDAEMMDLLHSCETYFRIRQKQGIDIHATHTQCALKNHKRGYYDCHQED